MEIVANIKEVSNNGQSEIDQINLDVTFVKNNPISGVGFSNINYANLNAEEKQIVDSFVNLIKLKTPIS